MSKIDIKRAVSQDRKVQFEFYRNGLFWYKTEFRELFSVPLEELGTAALNREEKALLFMRYMRKWNESNG